MKSENSILVFAVITLVIAAVSLGLVYNSASLFRNSLLTGYYTTNGTILVNITSNIAVNLSVNTINFGLGYVSNGTARANIISNGTSTNWTVVSGSIPTSGFVLDNIGNVNVSVSMKAGKNATLMLGGLNPLYQFNPINGEPNSCVSGPGVVLGTWYDLNTTSRSLCANLSYVTGGNRLNVSILLSIPVDAPATNATDQIEFSGDKAY